jgi:hypothetical protein
MPCIGTWASPSIPIRPTIAQSSFLVDDFGAGSAGTTLASGNRLERRAERHLNAEAAISMAPRRPV